MSSILETAGAVGFSSANPSANIQPTDEKGSVTLDQVKNWDPEVIITTNNELRQTVAVDSQWRGITAVKNNRVYSNPAEATFDGMKSLMGLIWIATLLYPDKVGIDFSREVHSYQALFNKIKD